MRTIHNILGIGITAFLALACQSETIDEPSLNHVQITFNAGFAGQESTKTVIHEDGTSIYWSSQDSISVFHGALSSAKFIATNTEPAAFTTFQGTFNMMTGSIESGLSRDIWAVYPYSPETTCDGDSVTLTVPAEQTAIPGTFAPGMFPSIARTKSYDLAFYNVCGGIVFSVVNEGIQSVVLTGNNGDTLAGTVKVTFDTEGHPAVQEVVSGQKTITLSVPDGECFIPGEKYFITVLPGILENGCSLTFHKAHAESTLVKNASTTINRSLFKRALEADQGMTFVDTLRLIVSPNEFELSNAAQDITVEIEANVRYSIEISQEDREWIGVYESNDLSDTWRFLIAANETPDVREGKILFRQNDGALTDTVFVRQEAIQASPIEFPEAIDLGLSVKWASFNLGATKPEEYGDYYAWGETETKSDYSEATYKFGTSYFGPFSKYNYLDDYGPVDNKTVLENEDDVAYVKLGGKWRMPTDAEWAELSNYCTWTWTTLNEVNGCMVTSKKNGNSIFLPAAGYRNGTSLYDAGSYGFYWFPSLSTTGNPFNACYIYFYNGGRPRHQYWRSWGLSVRPVSE